MPAQKLKKATIPDDVICKTLLPGWRLFGNDLSVCENPALGFVIFKDHLKNIYYYFKGRITVAAIHSILKSRKQELNTSLFLVVKKSISPSRFFLNNEIFTIREQIFMQIKLVLKMLEVRHPSTIKIIKLNREGAAKWLPIIEKTAYTYLHAEHLHAFMNNLDGVLYLAIYNESIVSLLIHTRSEKTATIEWIWTTPSLRRKRLATLLVSTLLGDAYKLGIVTCVINTSSHLIELFEKMHFLQDETLTFYEFKGHPIKTRHLNNSFSYCQSLKSKKDYLDCVAELSSHSLPLHPDGPKNWDSLAALSLVIKTFGDKLKNIKILDAGGELYSSILPQLEACGAKNLYCLNLAITSRKKVGNITYDRGDITQTQFGSERFDAIVCMSVVEHGVNQNKYFCEMSRILKPGGILFTSTDFWPEAIQTPSKLSYGKPIKIFDSKSVERLVNKSKKWGFKLMGELDLTSRDKVVHCDGISYTFLYFTLQKM